MIHLIPCEIDRAAGALPRLLGLIERRGFEVARLDMEPSERREDAARSRIVVGVSARDPDRSVAALARHIDQLYGVRRVDVAPFAEPA